METYELKLEDFSGPIEKLLELIEGRKLEVTRFSLAEVTADFLRYIESLEKVTPKVLADFISVAAKLILVKSHTLLPELKLSEEEEREITDLEDRLKFYEGFRRAEENLRKRWQKQVAFGKAYLANLPQGFYLTQKIKPADLLKEIERLAAELESLAPALKQEKIKLITLEEKISELIERLDKTLPGSFNSITGGKERPEIIILFLALLHLLKDTLVRVEQDKPFSDIKITKS